MVAYLDPFEQLQAELDRMLRSAFGGTTGAGVYPPVNVFERGDAFVLKAELPGVDPASIDLSVENDSVIIRGERTLPAADRQSAYHRRERPEGAFRRVVRMPGTLAPDDTAAEYANGVLSVTVHKAPQARARRVDVQAG